MSDETSNPVVEPEVKEEISPLAEDTTPKPDIQGTPTQEEKVSPLEPGGDRFKQVWARAKQAEAERDRLREETQREREERIRMEERLKALETQKQVAQEYTWTQLEDFIAEGKITRAQAQEYRENLVAQKAKETVKKELKAELGTQDKSTKILSEIGEYKKLVPSVLETGSEERQKVQQEYQYMVQELGMPETYATELAATRAALGDLNTLRERLKTKSVVTNKEPFMETHTPPKQISKAKSPIDSLSDREKEHYEKMIKAGRYKGGWKDVEAELSFTPKIVRLARG